MLAAQACCDPIEQSVERRSELRQLIARLAEAEAVVELTLAPRRRLPRHLTHGTERQRQGPPRNRCHEHEDDHPEDHRGEQGDALGLLVGRHRDAGHDRAESASVEDHRFRVELGVDRVDLEEARRPVLQPCRSSGDHTVRCRPLDRAAVREDPEVRVLGGIVRRIGHNELSVLHAQKPPLGARTALCEITRVLLEGVDEDEVEPGDQRDHRHADGGHDHEQQPGADAEPAHWKR